MGQKIIKGIKELLSEANKIVSTITVEKCKSIQKNKDFVFNQVFDQALNQTLDRTFDRTFDQTRLIEHSIERLIELSLEHSIECSTQHSINVPLIERSIERPELARF